MGGFELADKLSELTKCLGDFIAGLFRMVWSFATIVLVGIGRLVLTRIIYSLLHKLKTYGTEQGKGDKSKFARTQAKLYRHNAPSPPLKL